MRLKLLARRHLNPRVWGSGEAVELVRPSILFGKEKTLFLWVVVRSSHNSGSSRVCVVTNPSEVFPDNLLLEIRRRVSRADQDVRTNFTLPRLANVRREPYVFRATHLFAVEDRLSPTV